MTRSDASLGLYDLLLLVMPLSLALGGIVSVVSSLSVAAGMLGGSIPAGGAVWYGLFVDPPESGA